MEENEAGFKRRSKSIPGSGVGEGKMSAGKMSVAIARSMYTKGIGLLVNLIYQGGKKDM